MTRLRDVVRHALGSGTVASLAATAALVLAARAEGKAAPRSTNATSQWLNGNAAAGFGDVDLDHTAVGYATHHAATLLWALAYEAWLARHPAAMATTLLGRAALVSAVAAAVDYGATPRRFTPGWEFVLTKRSMALAYAAMAVGLAVGAARRRA